MSGEPCVPSTMPSSAQNNPMSTKGCFSRCGKESDVNDDVDEAVKVVGDSELASAWLLRTADAMVRYIGRVSNAARRLRVVRDRGGMPATFCSTSLSSSTAKESEVLQGLRR